MKRMTKYFALFLTLALMMVYFSAGMLATANELSLEEEQAYVIRQQLLTFFADRSCTQGEELIYPDFVGGVYYDDNGTLVLQIVEASRNIVQHNLIRGVLEEKGIVIEYVEFSYNNLRAAMNYLVERIIPDDRPDVLENVSGIGLNEMINRLEIYLFVYNEEEIARFRNEILDLPLISFVQSEGPSIRGSVNSGFPANVNQTITPFSNAIWLLLIAGIGMLCALSVFLLWKRKRNALAVQMADGGVVSGKSRVSRKQVVDAARNRERVPEARDDLLVTILEKIKEIDS